MASQSMRDALTGAGFASNRAQFAARGDDWDNNMREDRRPRLASEETRLFAQRQADRAASAAIAAAQARQTKPHAAKRTLTLREHQLDNRDRLLAEITGKRVNLPPAAHDTDLGRVAIRQQRAVLPHTPAELDAMATRAKARVEADRAAVVARRKADFDALAAEFGWSPL